MAKHLKLFGYITIFMVISCTGLNKDSVRPVPIHSGVDKELKQYIKAFVQGNPQYHKAWRKYRLTAGFYPFTGTSAGACYYFGPGIREISIDPEIWETSSSAERWALIYHELVHCLCNRDHTHSNGEYGSPEEEDENEDRTEKTGYFDDGCATSIMHPRIQKDFCIRKHQDHYLQEMMNDCDP